MKSGHCMLPVKITRIDPTLPLPEYQTRGSVAFDLSPRIDVTIPPQETILTPTNLIIEVPEGYVLFLVARSSLHKKGLVLANQIGIVDQDFCGPEDEIHLALRNIADQPVTITRGTRVAQGCFIPVAHAAWDELERSALTATARGGFGSTGM